jgi:hypothetical protein
MFESNNPPRDHSARRLDQARALSQRRGISLAAAFDELARQELKQPAPAPAAPAADTSLYGQYVTRMAASGSAPRVVPSPPPPPAPPPEKTDQQKADEAVELSKAKGISIVDAFKQLGYWT